MNLDWATNILFSADSPPMYLPDKTGDDEFFLGFWTQQLIFHFPSRPVSSLSFLLVPLRGAGGRFLESQVERGEIRLKNLVLVTAPLAGSRLGLTPGKDHQTQVLWWRSCNFQLFFGYLEKWWGCDKHDSMRLSETLCDLRWRSKCISTIGTKLEPPNPLVDLPLVAIERPKTHDYCRGGILPKRNINMITQWFLGEICPHLFTGPSTFTERLRRNLRWKMLTRCNFGDVPWVSRHPKGTKKKWSAGPRPYMTCTCWLISIPTHIMFCYIIIV